MSLQAGAAQVDITPSFGIQIAGDIGRIRPVEEVRDPIYARALVMESEGRKFCILTLDLLLVTAQWTAKIRELAQARCGIDGQCIMVCPTQTHSAPALGHFFVEDEADHDLPHHLRWLLGGDDDYHEQALEGAVRAIEQANSRLMPVTVAAASGIEARVAFNRRFVMRDGSGKTHPRTGDPHIRYSEGPMDPEVGMTAFRGESGQIIAALLHHTCHPIHGYPHRYISADWPGLWCEAMKDVLGDGCVPLTLNGCCGNIAPRNHLNIHQVPCAQTMAATLTETASLLLPELEYAAVGSFDWRTCRLAIPWREFDPALFEEARCFLKNHPEPIWKDDSRTAVEWPWVYAFSQLGVEKRMRRESVFEYEIQVLRLGDIAIAALPGEPFVEGQLQIKLESPTYPTYIAHMANHYVGYIPTLRAFENGGYETNASNGSKLAPQALDLIIDATRDALTSLFT